jgi:hypothetical protein
MFNWALALYQSGRVLESEKSLQTRGKRDEARAAFRSATENLEHTLGSGHPETRTARQLAELDNPQM